MNDDEPLNRKNITGLVTGLDDDVIDLDGEPAAPQTQQAELMQEAPPKEEEEENAIIDVIDVGLDFAADFLADNGYPPLKRKLWEQRGKKAMNKALNAYCPAGSALGGVLDSSIAALGIGVLSLVLCFMPVIMHVMKKRNESGEPQPAAADAGAGHEPETEPVRYEAPETHVTSSAPISNMNVTPIDRIQQGNKVDMLPGF